MSTLEELATKPAMPAPDGQETDFNQHTEYPNILLGSFVVSYFLATLFLALRLYTTSAIVRRFDLDDGASTRWTRIRIGILLTISKGSLFWPGVYQAPTVLSCVFVSWCEQGHVRFSSES